MKTILLLLLLIASCSKPQGVYEPSDFELKSYEELAGMVININLQAEQKAQYKRRQSGGLSYFDRFKVERVLSRVNDCLESRWVAEKYIQLFEETGNTDYIRYYRVQMTECNRAYDILLWTAQVYQ